MSSKQREALLAVYDCAKDGVLVIRESAFEKVREALAEPLRNCDVGSVKEQYHRFCICCTEHKMPCRRSYTFGCAECYAKWSQMPYDEGGAE